jgi:hydroxymethylbilane synthase
MLPAPGQGALAVQCRSGDAELLEILRVVHHTPTARAVAAERAFLAGLGGGCSAPIAAYAAQAEGAGLAILGLVASADGTRVIRVRACGEEPLELGARLARMALEQGASEVLA